MIIAGISLMAHTEDCDQPVEDAVASGWEEPPQWSWKLRSGSLFVVGPILESAAAGHEDLTDARARANREERDGPVHHITVLHRSELAMAKQQHHIPEKGGLSPELSLASPVKCAKALTKTLADLLPACLLEPVPLYVYRTRGEQWQATAVRLLVIPGDYLLHMYGQSQRYLYMTLGFTGSDVRDDSARALGRVDVLRVCHSLESLLVLLDALIETARKSPMWDFRLRIFELCHEVLQLIDGHVPAEDEAVKVALLFTKATVSYEAGEILLSLSQGLEALEILKDMSVRQAATKDLWSIAYRKVCAALISLGDWSSAKERAEEALNRLEEESEILKMYQECLQQELNQLKGVTRYRLRALGVDLPRNSSWVAPWKLGGMSQPESAAQIDVLSRIGVRLIVTLYETPCVRETWLAAIPQERRPEVLFLEVANYTPPSDQQISLAIRAARTASGSIMVHCDGGKGRAGTLLAILMMELLDELWLLSASARDVIARLRELRPGSIETDVQEQAVIQWHKQRMVRIHGASEEGTTDSAAEPTAALAAEFVAPTTRALMLVGLPGSGKSTIARVLTKLAPDMFIWVNQDEAGHRSRFYGMVKDALSKHVGNRPLVLLDRSNVKAEARVQLLEEVGLCAKEVEVVELALEEAECAQRVMMRTNHATLHFQPDSKGDHQYRRALDVVRDFVNKLSWPHAAPRQEGFRAVHQVDSARNFISQLLGETVPLSEIDAAIQDDIATHTHRSYHGQSPSVAEAHTMRMYKFPRTRHIAVVTSADGRTGVTRDDLVMDAAEAARILDGRTIITVEEKLDGANLGISLDPETQELRFQNRSRWVSSESSPQFKGLEGWPDKHRGDLYRLLLGCRGGVVLYGEWLLARHTVSYTRLPGWFVLFDIFDLATGRFLAADARDRYVREECGVWSIPLPPRLAHGSFNSIDELKALLSQPSAYNPGVQIEGVYLRVDSDGYLKERAKLVNAEFVQAVESDGHWASRKLVKNGLEVCRDSDEWGSGGSDQS